MLAEPGSVQSANGWVWTSFPGPSGGDLATILALNGSTLIAAGMRDPDDRPMLGIWFGNVTYPR